MLSTPKKKNKNQKPNKSQQKVYNLLKEHK